MGDSCVRDVGNAASKWQALLVEAQRRKESRYVVAVDSDLRSGRGVVETPRGLTCWCGAKEEHDPKVWQKSKLEFCEESTPCEQCQQGNYVCVEDTGKEKVNNKALKELVATIVATEVTESEAFPRAEPVRFFDASRWRSWFN